MNPAPTRLAVQALGLVAAARRAGRYHHAWIYLGVVCGLRHWAALDADPDFQCHDCGEAIVSSPDQRCIECVTARQEDRVLAYLEQERGTR